ncbi:MAG: hypothetical protein M5U28_31945 [Sandaracinaceae bacterium]|nr:hypothetical protein [Sandaracinaceae bacterium]
MVVVLGSAGQLVVLAAPVAVHAVLGIEVSVVGEADPGRAQVRDGRARRVDERAHDGLVDARAEAARASRQERVPGEVAEGRVAVARRDHHLARVLGAELGLHVVHEALVAEGEIDLHEDDRLAAGRERQRAHARDGLDADRGREGRAQEGVAAVARILDEARPAEALGAIGVGGQRRAERHVEERLRDARRERAALHRPARAARRRHLLEGAVIDRGDARARVGSRGRPGVGPRVAAGDRRITARERERQRDRPHTQGTPLSAHPSRPYRAGSSREQRAGRENATGRA